MTAPPASGVDPRLDTGLAAERTAMAWGRSALGYVALAALFARAGVEGHHEVIALPVAVVLLALAALLGRLGTLGYDDLGHSLAGVGRRGAIELACAGAALAAIAGAVLSVLD